jgi:hypothetical protein
LELENPTEKLVKIVRHSPGIIFGRIQDKVQATFSVKKDAIWFKKNEYSSYFYLK